MTASSSICKAPTAFVRRDLSELGDGWFGRYRLWFDQVSPRFDDYAALLTIPDDHVAYLEELVDDLPPLQNWPLHIVRPDDHFNDYANAERERPYLCFEMLSDVCYIDMRNLHWAAAELAPLVDDGHFFAYSSGDGFDRWLDEYRFADGGLEVTRHVWHEPHLRDSRLDFYREQEALRDEEFRSFVRRCCAAHHPR